MFSDIPKTIHKILILDKSKFYVEPQIQNIHNKWKSLNPGYTILYWNLQNCRYYLARMGAHYVELFDKIKANAGKADFFRYIVLYQMGGWYSDWRQIPKCSIQQMVGDNVDKQVYYIDDLGLEYTYRMRYKQNCFIGSVPGNPVLKYAFQLCMYHVTNEIYGDLAIDATACKVISMAINRYPDICFSIGFLTRVPHPSIENYNVPVVVSHNIERDISDSIIIVHKIAESTFEEQEFKDGNNYTVLWRTGKFYENSIKIIGEQVTEKRPESPTPVLDFVWVSMYTGNGLFYALRDEIMPSENKDVLITCYDVHSFRDRWRVHLLKRVARNVYFNGINTSELSPCPSTRSLRMLEAVDLEDAVFQFTNTLSLTNSIGPRVQNDPSAWIFLFDGSHEIYDYLTEAPIEYHWKLLGIRSIDVRSVPTEVLIEELSKAKSLIAIYGDCLANMVLVPPKCLVIEISLRGGTSEECRDACWHNLARSLSQPYRELICERTEDNNVFVDTPLLLNLLLDKVTYHPSDK